MVYGGPVKGTSAIVRRLEKAVAVSGTVSGQTCLECWVDNSSNIVSHLL